MVFIRVVGLLAVWHLLLAFADDVRERRERHQEEFLKDLIEGFGLPPSGKPNDLVLSILFNEVSWLTECR